MYMFLMLQLAIFLSSCESFIKLKNKAYIKARVPLNQIQNRLYDINGSSAAYIYIDRDSLVVIT